MNSNLYAHDIWILLATLVMKKRENYLISYYRKIIAYDDNKLLYVVGLFLGPLFISWNRAQLYMEVVLLRKKHELKKNIS